MLLGETIYRAREAKGISLRALARAVDLSPAYVSDIEHGRRRPKELSPFAKALGVPLAELEMLKITESADEWARRNPDVAKLLRAVKRRRCPWCHRGEASK